MCEPPRASVVERGAVLWWVAGFLTYRCPLNIRPLPRGWSEHRRASVRSARGVPRVCIEGNSHSEAEVSNRHGRASGCTREVGWVGLLGGPPGRETPRLWTPWTFSL